MSTSQNHPVLSYLQTLMTENNPLYAIVDAAQSDYIIQLLYQHSEKTEIQSLFEGKKGQEMASVAPYLVSFTTPDHPLLLTLVEKGWGNHWGVYLRCSGGFEAVRKQLRQCIRIKGSDGDYRQFRFYDPRVFIEYMPTFDANQLSLFFGEINSYWVADANKTAFNYQLDKQQLLIQRIDETQAVSESDNPSPLNTE